MPIPEYITFKVPTVPPVRFSYRQHKIELRQLVEQDGGWWSCIYVYVDGIEVHITDAERDHFHKNSDNIEDPNDPIFRATLTGMLDRQINKLKTAATIRAMRDRQINKLEATAKIMDKLCRSQQLRQQHSDGDLIDLV